MFGKKITYWLLFLSELLSTFLVGESLCLDCLHLWKKSARRVVIYMPPRTTTVSPFTSPLTSALFLANTGAAAFPPVVGGVTFTGQPFQVIGQATPIGQFPVSVRVPVNGQLLGSNGQSPDYGPLLTNLSPGNGQVFQVIGQNQGTGQPFQVIGQGTGNGQLFQGLGQGTGNGQYPVNVQEFPNGLQFPNNGQLLAIGQRPNNGQQVNNGQFFNNGQLPNNGQVFSNGQLFSSNG